MISSLESTINDIKEYINLSKQIEEFYYIENIDRPKTKSS